MGCPVGNLAHRASSSPLQCNECNQHSLEIGEVLNILINLSDKKMLGDWNKMRESKEKLMSKTKHEGILNVNIETIYGVPIVTLSSYLFFTVLDVD